MCTYVLKYLICEIREKILNSVNSEHQLILKVLKNETINKRLQIFKEVED